MELRDGSLIKVTPLNSEFGETLYVKTLKVSGRLVSWDEETIRLKKVGVPFRAKKAADVYYDIPVAEATNIIFKKTGIKGLSYFTKTFIGIIAVFGFVLYNSRGGIM